MIDERRVKNNQATKVARKSHEDCRRRYGIGPFVGNDSNRDDYQRPGDIDDRTSTVPVVMRPPPVNRGNVGVGGVRNWERSDCLTCDYDDKPGNVDGTVDWTKPRTTRDANANIDVTADGTTDGYHPVRRRLLEDYKRDQTATPAAAVDASAEDRQRRRPDIRQWFRNYWRPKPSSVAVPEIHQHHHRRVHWHRHHHHHTHCLHMWTSSCCWWLLVFYAVVVVVASFARAAHSAKDGKYITIL